MKRTVILCSALAFTCAMAAVPAAANASNDGARRWTQVQYIGAIPASAEALSPSILAPAKGQDDNSDGLTRRTDECNRGCIDN